MKLAVGIEHAWNKVVVPGVRQQVNRMPHPSERLPPYRPSPALSLQKNFPGPSASTTVESRVASDRTTTIPPVHCRNLARNGAHENPDSQEQALCRQGGCRRRRRQGRREAIRHRRRLQAQVRQAQERPAPGAAAQGEEPRPAAEEAQEEDIHRGRAQHPHAQHGDARRRRQAQGQEEGQGLCRRHGMRKSSPTPGEFIETQTC